MTCARLLAILRHLSCLLSDIDFVLFRTARQLFDNPTIAVTRAEIHSGVDICGVITQDAFHNRCVFKKLLPILRSKQTQTEDAVDNDVFMTSWETRRLLDWQDICTRSRRQIQMSDMS